MIERLDNEQWEPPPPGDPSGGASGDPAGGGGQEPGSTGSANTDRFTADGSADDPAGAIGREPGSPGSASASPFTAFGPSGGPADPGGWETRGSGSASAGLFTAGGPSEGPVDPGGWETGPPETGGANGPAAVDVHWLRETIKLAKRCPPSRTAFSVGAVIVAADGTLLATGFSRERDLRDHAEEVALARIAPGDQRLAGATIYSSVEPCGVRASRPRPCADLIISAGIPRVVYAWHEPPLLAAGGGTEMLRAAGVSVTEVPELASEARAVNAHLVKTDPA
jgi:diaminohydroxyphosphoribosylaminopyrimidine deaminase / 5-amino-6-(5-phosphoribosylamino)uracil reductase